ncbi:MAG: MATE family efflux transporter [Oscillospiraceae bacterium]|nr:MATE family efflux transporter [Oscillospiraceae bacterium]
MTAKPMFSNRALTALAVPIVLEALLAIMAGLVDTAMVSSAGEAAVGAISLVDSVNLLFIYVFSAIANGGAVVTAQYIGSKNLLSAKTSANQLLYAASGVSLVLMAVLLCFVQPILNLIYPGIAPDVFQNAHVYFFYTLLGYPFFAVGNACTALLRSMAKSRLALFIALSSNIFNVIGNAILIYGFDLGAAGAAISTTVSRVLWAAAGLYFLHNKDLPVHLEKLLSFRFDWDIMRRIMLIGSANGVESGLFQVGKVLVSSLIASFGTIATAAYSVSYTICSVGWNTVGAIGTVLLTVVGQCMGAGETEQAKHYTKKLTWFAYGMVLVLFGSIFLFRNQLVGLFSFSNEAKTASVYYTAVGVLCTVFSVYAWSFVPVNAFRASGETRYSMILAIVSMFTFRVGLSYVLGAWMQLGLLGVWIGMWADWACRSVFNSIHFKRGKWLQRKLI